MSYFITEVNNSLQLSKFDDQSENNNSITLYTPLPTKVSFTPGTPGILSVNNGQFYFQNIDKYLYTTVLTYNDIGPIIDELRYGFMVEDMALNDIHLVLVGIGSHTEYIMKYRASSYNNSLNCEELILFGNILSNVNYLYHIYVLYSDLISDTMVSITVLDSNNKVLTSVQQYIYENNSIFPNLYIIAKNAHIFRLEMDPMPTNRYMYIAGIPIC